MSPRAPLTLIAAAGLLGVDPAELRAACTPSTRTMADVINDAPIVSMAEAVNDEAARLGKPADELTEVERRHAWQRAVLAVLPSEVPADPVAEGVASILLACSMMARIADRLATERLLRALKQAHRLANDPPDLDAWYLEFASAIVCPYPAEATALEREVAIRAAAWEWHDRRESDLRGVVQA